MEFRDLKAQYRALQEEIDQALLAAVRDGAYIMGPQVQQLERELAAYVGVEHCIGCANGTDALTMVLMGWGIGPGDAVFVPDFTFFATGEVVSFEGAQPVFVDVDPDTFNLDAEKLEREILRVRAEGTLTPRAIIAVDLFGQPADYDALEALAQRYGLLLLEDGAQGFGGRIGERRACSFGHAATTSFFPAKPLGCYGDGGAVFTDDDELAAYLRSVQVHGKGAFKYDNVRIGMNSRLDTLQAAVLLPKFHAFVRYELDSVQETAKLYTKKLAGLVKTPAVREGYRSSWAQYTIVLQSAAIRDAVQAALREQGIPTMVYYPKPMHRQSAFAALPDRDADRFPVTEALCARVLSLPMHPYLREEDVDRVCGALREALQAR